MFGVQITISSGDDGYEQFYDPIGSANWKKATDHNLDLRYNQEDAENAPVFIYIGRLIAITGLGYDRSNHLQTDELQKIITQTGDQLKEASFDGATALHTVFVVNQ
jgi:hypothetical protein